MNEPTPESKTAWDVLEVCNPYDLKAIGLVVAVSAFNHPLNLKVTIL